ncbi:MAG: aminoglycoside phosphotransferase family protein [Dehalococcoidia bacterium]|nr:aminoglycoside phosphotransferase family protein [Dehalococcoidia bacterium]
MGTDTAPTEPSVDPRAALAALGYAETTEPQRVKGGWETLLWHFATPDGREHSLRVHHLPDREEFARHERLALQTCEKGGLPAPRLEATGDFQELPAMVLSWCPGRPLLSYVEQRPWAIWRLGRLFGRAQAQVHALTPPPEFLAAAPDDWLLRIDEEYADLATHARTLGLSTSSLIHMDFHPLNLLSDGTAVTGVIDWPRAGAGDPRADLARTEITLLAAPIPPGPAAAFLNLARRLILRAWRSGYRETAGLMPDYRPFRAWAGATLLAEIIPIIDQPNVWGTREDIEKFRRLVDVWARDEGVR